MSRNIESLLSIIEKNHGRITTKEVVYYGFRREILSELVEAGLLIREARGIYCFPGKASDIYSILQHSCPKAVFSYETALWFCGLLTEEPDRISITVQQGANVSRLKKKCTELDVFYVHPDVLELGVKQMPSPVSGGMLSVYDTERCICDMIRSHHYKSREHANDRQYIQALKLYFLSKEKNLQRLQQYAHRYSIEDQVYHYMEFLM